MQQPNVQAFLTGGGLNAPVGIWRITPLTAPSMPYFWKPSDIDGKFLTEQIGILDITNRPESLLGYEFQRLKLSNFVYQDSD